MYVTVVKEFIKEHWFPLQSLFSGYFFPTLKSVKTPDTNRPSTWLITASPFCHYLTRITRILSRVSQHYPCTFVLYIKISNNLKVVLFSNADEASECLWVLWLGASELQLCWLHTACCGFMVVSESASTDISQITVCFNMKVFACSIYYTDIQPQLQKHWHATENVYNNWIQRWINHWHILF